MFRPSAIPLGRVTKAVVPLLLIGLLASLVAANSSRASSKIVIGFAQAFSSNTWQQANDKSAAAAIKVLKSQGKIAGYDFLDANNSVSTQVSQIQDLVLKHVSVILIDPVSASGENGAIQQAMAAHIPVLVFSDGPVTSTLPYELEFRHAEGEQQQAEYIAKRLHGKGNVLLIRGVAGTGGDNAFYQGMQAGLKKYPKIKVAATVYGNWSPSDSQSAVAKVLPNLPKIDGIINEGSGEEYGAIQAFQAAGRKAPLTVGGDEGSFLQWWAKEHKKNGYTTESATPNAGIGAAAVYVGYDLAKGVKVPKSMNFPWLRITQKTLKKYAKTGFNAVAYKIPTLAWTEANVIKSAGPLMMAG